MPCYNDLANQGEEVCEMKDDKKIKTEKIVLNGLVIAGIVLTLLAVLASPFIIVAGVLAFAMGGVFKRAAVIKEENDEIF